MTPTIAHLLALSFLASIATLAVLIRAVRKHHMRFEAAGAKVIFEPGELGRSEDPARAGPDAERAASDRASDPELALELRARAEADASTRGPVLLFVLSAVAWLVVGSVFGLVASLQLTFPDWLVEPAAFSFGRLRPMHLNAVIYGWASMAGIAVLLWLLPRLLRTPLRGQRFALAGGWLWNAAVAVGLVAIARGWSEGVEWLEFPWAVDLVLAIAGGLVAVPLFLTAARRRVAHLYVSVWYLAAALVWFPILFVVANWPGLHFGVEHAVVNWWFAHNVLGLWLTPIGLAAAYYFIPKVIGQPVHSYGLSLVGFWSLALFYSQAGIHHLVGGPVPTWLVTLSIVQSVMMVVPVVAVAINHHLTIRGHFHVLRRSPTLRFVVTGAMMYTLVSFIGSLQSVRAINRVLHFTHFTVAHAHHGVYLFYSFIVFGSLYFLLPRALKEFWPSPFLVNVHYWLALVGAAVYVVGLSIGGVLQGLAMLDGARPFTDSITVTIPYLHARTVGGALMTTAHVVFAVHVAWLVTRARRTAAERAVAMEQTAPAAKEVVA